MLSVPCHNPDSVPVLKNKLCTHASTQADMWCIMTNVNEDEGKLFIYCNRTKKPHANVIGTVLKISDGGTSQQAFRIQHYLEWTLLTPKGILTQQKIPQQNRRLDGCGYGCQNKFKALKDLKAELQRSKLLGDRFCSLQTIVENESWCSQGFAQCKEISIKKFHYVTV